MRKNNAVVAEDTFTHPVVRNVFRWIIYILLIFFAFIFANSGDFIKPYLLIPISLCISSVSDLRTSAIVGLCCGFLMDMSGGTLLGYRALLLFLMCMITAVLYDRFMQQHFVNTLLFTAVATFIVTGLDFIFRYAIWEYDHLFYLYTHYSLRILLYTVISAAILHPIFLLIHKFLLPPRKRVVEETVKAMDET